MNDYWSGLTWTIAERPANPIDMGMSMDPLTGTIVLWSMGDDLVAHIEVLNIYEDTNHYPPEGKDR